VSSFPTKILLATDGSEEATLATQTATDLGERTGSELHVVHVGEIPPTHYPDRYGYSALYEEDEREARQLLEAQIEKMKATGATVAQVPLWVPVCETYNKPDVVANGTQIRPEPSIGAPPGSYSGRS
jgi:nucleotide-binding universal stress UspA family protein